MSGLKIVLKLNRAKVCPSGVSSGSAPPPPGTAPIVGQPVPEDSGAHSKKEKKAKKEKKKHKRRRHEHGGAPASGDEAAGGDAAPEGERPSKKQKRQDQTTATGGIAVTPAPHQPHPASSAAPATTAVPAAEDSGAAAATAAAPMSAAVAPPGSIAPAVKISIKAPKLRIKGPWGRAGPSAAAAVDPDGDPLNKKVKKKKKRRLPGEVPTAGTQPVQHPTAGAAGAAAVVSNEGQWGNAVPALQMRKKRRRREGAEGRDVKSLLMAGLLTPSVSEQAGGGGTSTGPAAAPQSSGFTSPVGSAPLQGAESKAVVVPVGPPDRKNLERVIDKLQKKDPHKIFSKPVTEEEAPGYAAIIVRPMDFSTIRSKLMGGDYDKESAWSELQQDMETMFTNAMTYNPAETFVHKQARSLMEFSNKVIELGRQGVTDFRGRTNSIARAHNAQIAEEERASREAARTAERAAKLAERNVKLKQRAVASGMVPAPQRVYNTPVPRPYYEPEVSGMMVDDTVRMTHHPKSRDLAVAGFKGLAYGANAAGVPYASSGKLALHPTSSQMQPQLYAARLAAFMRKFRGKARTLAIASLTRVQFSGPSQVQQSSRLQPTEPTVIAMA